MFVIGLQEYDSYKLFRSKGFNLNLSFETGPCLTPDLPSCLLYSSTLRWMDKLKVELIHYPNFQISSRTLNCSSFTIMKLVHGGDRLVLPLLRPPLPSPLNHALTTMPPKVSITTAPCPFADQERVGLTQSTG